MTDPASTALAAPRLALGAGAAAYEAAVERARDRGVGEPPVRPRRRRCGRPTRGSPRPIAGAPRLARCAGALHRADRRPRGLRRRRRRRGLHDRGRRRHGRQQPRPGHPAPDVRLDRGLPRAAHPRLDRPGLRAATPRRPRPAADARHHRQQVGHDDRAATRSWPTPGSGPRRPSRRSRTIATSIPARYFAAITDPGKSDAIKHSNDFREVFLNPPDIGGRYSALTYVGLVPASLIGLDLDALLAAGAGDARRLPRAGPGAQPGPVARHRHRRRWPRAAATS